MKLFRYADYGQFCSLQQDGEFKGFLSTSIAETATQHLADDKVVIRAPKTTKGVFVGERSEVSEERIQRNAKYRTLHVDLESKMVEIELYD